MSTSGRCVRIGWVRRDAISVEAQAAPKIVDSERGMASWGLAVTIRPTSQPRCDSDDVAVAVRGGGPERVDGDEGRHEESPRRQVGCGGDNRHQERYGGGRDRC